MKTYVIGVTGHRDIHPHAYEQVKAEAECWLDHMISQKSDVPIQLLSPLASGADQLLANLAIERNISLHVPLPFPIERYLLDFEVGKERSRFLALLEQAERTFVPELSLHQINDAFCYFGVGAYVAQQSHLLFGLWDGQKSPEKMGGTSHIIRCQLQGFPENMCMTSARLERKTIWIQTPRTIGPFFSTGGSLLTLEHYNSIGMEV